MSEIKVSIWDTLPEHIKEVIKKGNRQKDAADALAAAMEEVLEVFEANEYIPDSFTFQPLRIALREYKEISNG